MIFWCVDIKKDSILKISKQKVEDRLAGVVQKKVLYFRKGCVSVYSKKALLLLKCARNNFLFFLFLNLIFI